MAGRSIRRDREQPGVSSGQRSRSNDEASIGGTHQGQQSARTAPTGRTHDCKRYLDPRTMTSCGAGAIHTWNLGALVDLCSHTFSADYWTVAGMLSSTRRPIWPP
jgi:hypothetical protein